MRNPLESPNFWLTVVILVTVFALATYQLPDVSLTGAVSGSSVPVGQDAVQVMTFGDDQTKPIYGKYSESFELGEPR